MTDPDRYGDMSEEDESFVRLTGLVRLRHAARYLGVSADDLRGRVWTGRLHGRKLGSQWYVSESEIERYEQRRGPRRVALG
jgi:hypothetical protein